MNKNFIYTTLIGSILLGNALDFYSFGRLGLNFYSTLGILVRDVYSIKCYVCSSNNDPDCVDPYDEDVADLMQCDSSSPFCFVRVEFFLNFLIFLLNRIDSVLKRKR